MKRIAIRTRSGTVHAYALVDDEDAGLADFPWHTDRKGYARRNLKKSRGPKDGWCVLMHRQIMGLGKGDKRQVDHLNHNVRDNRRSNLRIVSHSQNLQNRRGAARNNASGIRGCSWCAKAQKWEAYVGFGGKLLHLGKYDSARKAGAVAAAKRKELGFHGC